MIATPMQVKLQQGTKNPYEECPHQIPKVRTAFW